MSIKLAINGFGRIGRVVFRASLNHPDLEVVAINDLTDPATMAHLLTYDSVHGKLDAEVTNSENSISVNGRAISVTAIKDPAQLPWKSHGVDIVAECTGLFRDRESAAKHLSAGARKVIISAPAQEVDGTFVLGVNHKDYDASKHRVVSNASCTTNCLAPLVKPLHDAIGVVSGLMTTIHSYTNDQKLLDVYHSDLRRARATALSMIPTKTGAAAAVGLVLPELQGKLDGFAIRVPTPNVSMVDLTFHAARATTKEEIDQVLLEASQGALNGILGFNADPLVSIDFNHDPRSSIYESSLTRVAEGTLVKVCSWYDNEWGFSNRMLDTTLALMAAS